MPYSDMHIRDRNAYGPRVLKTPERYVTCSLSANGIIAGWARSNYLFLQGLFILCASSKYGKIYATIQSFSTLSITSTRLSTVGILGPFLLRESRKPGTTSCYEGGTNGTSAVPSGSAYYHYA